MEKQYQVVGNRSSFHFSKLGRVKSWNLLLYIDYFQYNDYFQWNSFYSYDYGSVPITKIGPPPPSKVCKNKKCSQINSVRNHQCPPSMDFFGISCWIMTQELFWYPFFIFAPMGPKKLSHIFREPHIDYQVRLVTCLCAPYTGNHHIWVRLGKHMCLRAWSRNRLHGQG